MLKLMLDEGLRSSMPVGIYQYQVNGMPEGQEAFITKKAGSVLDPRWELDYKTADEALAVLQREVQWA